MTPADMKSIPAQIKTTTPNKINDQQHLCSMQRPQHPQQGIHISINTKLKCLPRSPRATRHLHEYNCLQMRTGNQCWKSLQYTYKKWNCASS